MCSGMCIVCVQSVNGVPKVVNVCSGMWVYVLEDVIGAQGCGYMCSGMCIVCVQSVNGVPKVVNVCSGMWVYVLEDVIGAQKCDVFRGVGGHKCSVVVGCCGS
jgi:hypothetical protein